LIRRSALIVGVAAVVAACAGGGGGDRKGGGGPPGCACDPPGCPTVSFAGNVQPIMTRSCATSGRCHASNGAEGLDLRAGQTIANTVGVKSNQQPRVLLVKPGAPEDSYLYRKMVNTPGISGIAMPQGCPGTPLEGACPSADDIEAIEQWIIECATDTPSLP